MLKFQTIPRILFLRDNRIDRHRDYIKILTLATAVSVWEFKKWRKKNITGTFPSSFPSPTCERSSAIVYLLSLYFLGNSYRRYLPSRNVGGSGKSYLRARGIILLGMQIKPFKSSDELPELPACSKRGDSVTKDEKERSFVTLKMETKSTRVWIINLE